MKHYFLLLSVVTLALGGCSKDQYEGQDIVGEKLIVSAGINQVESRVSGTSWGPNDKIGVSCADANYDNILYVTESGDGTFSTTSSVYVLGGGTYTYTAYYPYSENVTSENTIINFTTPADYMWATADVTRENPNASFQFSHKMSKIDFTISDEGNAATSGTITLRNVYTSGQFDTATGNVTTSTETTGDLSSEFTIGTATSFIVPPVANLAGHKLSVLVEYNGKAYGGDLDLTALAVNTEYNFTVDLAIAESGEALSISSPVINGWTQEKNQQLTLDEEKLPNTLEIGDFLLTDGTVIDKADPDFETCKSMVAGVVYFVGNPQPSVLYSYAEEQDILKARFPNCINGLAIAINNANEGTAVRFATTKYDFSTWYKDEGNVSVSQSYIGTNLGLNTPGERMLGYNNTEVLKVASAELDTAPDSPVTGVSETLAILDSYNSANAVTNASTWYIPSYAELKEVVANYGTVNASVVMAGGTLTQFTEYVRDGATENFYWTSDLRGSYNNWVSPMCTPSGVPETDFYQTRHSNGTKGFFRLSIAF